MIITRRGLLGLFAALPAWAADFWEKEPDFKKWSAKDVDKMLNNSPWAQKTFVAMRGGGGGGGFAGGGGGGRRGGGGGVPGGAGGGGGFAGGGGGGGGRRGGGGGGGDVPMGPPPMEFIIRWHSSRPVKEAIIASRLQMEGTEMTSDMQAFLDREESHYILTVSGMPARMGQRFVANPGRLASFATLERKGKEPLTAESAEASEQPNQTVNLAFLFPRTEAITAADKEVEFIFKPAPGGGGQGRGGQGGQGGDGQARQRQGGAGLEIKRKFKLKDMMYGGTLSL